MKRQKKTSLFEKSLVWSVEAFIHQAQPPIMIYNPSNVYGGDWNICNGNRYCQHNDFT